MTWKESAVWRLPSLALAACLVSACTDDGNTSPVTDGPVSKQDGPALKQDGPPLKLDGSMPKQDGPALKQDGPPLKLDGSVPKQDGPRPQKDGPAPPKDQVVSADKVQPVDQNTPKPDAPGNKWFVVVKGTCQMPPGWPSTATCQTLAIGCQGLPTTQVQVFVVSPPAGTPQKGTVVFGTGGAGTAFYAGSAPGATAMKNLVKAGYTVVDRRWLSGWFGSSAKGHGIAKPSCRYARMLGWVHKNKHTKGAFCATGNSGGSSELAYSLTRHQASVGSLLRAAFLSSGPPMARIDIGCLGSAADPTWKGSCANIWTKSGQSCPSAVKGPLCDYHARPGAAGPKIMDIAYTQGSATTRCTGADKSAKALFVGDSVVYPGAVMSYPKTHVHFIYGKKDCTEAVPLGHLYYQAVKSQKSVQYVNNMPHQIFKSVDGMKALYQAILTRCK